jgi:ribosomal protein S18 acetylase RimI-like enzyme
MAADVHPARANDLDSLVAIEAAAFRTDRLSRRSLRRLIASPSAAVLIAELAGAVVGYCIVLFRAYSDSARLYSIAVAPPYAGGGFGVSLLRAAELEATARERQYLRLEVRADNTRAIGLYRRAGYHQFGKKPGYYEDGMAALLFRKVLFAGTLSAPSRPIAGRMP